MVAKRKFSGCYAVLCTGIVNAVLVLAVLNALLARRERRETPAAKTSERIFQKYGTNTMQSVYPDLDLPQIRQLLAETWDRPLFEYDPVTQFRERPFAGKYVNIDENGFRRTKNQGPWPPEASAFNVFVFGGSTTFGYGVPDEETLASHLQDVLADTLAREVRVYNFGRGSYYSTLERLLLEHFLLEGLRPDLALFVDGINDCYGYGRNPIVTRQIQQGFDLDNRAPTSRFLALGFQRLPLTRWLRRKLDERPEKDGGREGGYPPIDLEKYVWNKQMIEALCAAFDLPVLIVWHPSPYYKYNIWHHPFAQKDRTRRRGRQIAEGYVRMAEWAQTRPMGSNFLWLADIQEDVQDWLYVDDAHFSPRLSRMLAEAVASGIVARVSAAAFQSPGEQPPPEGGTVNGGKSGL